MAEPITEIEGDDEDNGGERGDGVARGGVLALPGRKWR